MSKLEEQAKNIARAQGRIGMTHEEFAAQEAQREIEAQQEKNRISCLVAKILQEEELLYTTFSRTGLPEKMIAAGRAYINTRLQIEFFHRQISVKPDAPMVLQKAYLVLTMLTPKPTPSPVQKTPIN